MGVIVYVHTYNVYVSNKTFYKPPFLCFLYLQVIVNQKYQPNTDYFMVDSFGENNTPSRPAHGTLLVW